MARKKTIVLVGDAPHGIFAALKARQYNEHARIIMVEEAPFLNWSYIHLKHHLHSDALKIEEDLYKQDTLFATRYNVEIKPRTKAIALDVDSRCIILDNSSSRERISFDALIFAGFVKSRMLHLPGLLGPRVVNFQNYDDFLAIKKAILAGARNALVIGCGISGIKAALSLKALGLSVTIVESKKCIMPRFSLQFAHAIQERLTVEGIALKLDTTIMDVKNNNESGYKLRLSSGENIETDLVVICIGIEPKNELLVHAGAALDGEGLVRVDDHMQTTLSNVYACAGAVSVPCAVDGNRRWLIEPAILQRTAHIAGINAAVDDQKAMDLVKPFCGTVMIEIGDRAFARTGVNEQEARALLGDDNVFVATVLDRDTCIKLIVDRTTERIIGGEVFGCIGIERHIDVVSLAIKEGFSPDCLIDVDMVSSEDFVSSYDLLKEVAMRARVGLLENTRFMSAEMLALWLKNKKKFRLVDVGDAPKLSGQMAIKAIHLPLEVLRDRMHELTEQDSPIVLYSPSGHQSYLAHQMLKQRGLTNVYHLDGGLMTWNLIASKE